MTKTTKAVTSTKKTSAKTAPVKEKEIKQVTENLTENKNSLGNEGTVDTVITETKNAPVTRVYQDGETITCRSITRGMMTLGGKKSGNYYIFSNYDDTCEIEVGDLNSLRATKSAFLYDPLFIIEDEEFLLQPKWAEIKTLYDNIAQDNVNEILELPLGEFKSALLQLPKGYKEALCAEATTRIQNDEFDSLNKIKAIDEICGTDLTCLIK